MEDDMTIPEDGSEEDVLNPRALLEHAGVKIGMTVADMGAGREGSFTIAAAKMVSVAGTVYSLDVVEEILEVITGMATQAGVDNVKTIWTDLEMYGAAQDIPDGSVDVGILANTMFQSENRADMLKECTRMIKHGGKLLVVEWKPVETVFGPPVEARVKPEDLPPMASKLGLKLNEQFEAGEYHWGMIFEK